MESEPKTLVWRNIDSLLDSRSRRDEFKQRMGRNKNTYTSWFSTGNRPNLRLTELFEIAEALGVEAADLLADQISDEKQEQLKLTFRDGSTAATLEIECTRGGLLLRPGVKSD